MHLKWVILQLQINCNTIIHNLEGPQLSSKDWMKLNKKEHLWKEILPIKEDVQNVLLSLHASIMKVWKLFVVFRQHQTKLYFTLKKLLSLQLYPIRPHLSIREVMDSQLVHICMVKTKVDHYFNHLANKYCIQKQVCLLKYSNNWILNSQV